jgi:hypothetical protein
VFLHNAFVESRDESTRQRRERIGRLVAAVTADPGPLDWASARASLRPVLRGVAFGRAGVPGMVAPVSRPALPFLDELVVVDRPDSMAYVMPRLIEEWGVTPQEVFAAARDNLEVLARRSLENSRWHRKTLVRMVDDGNGYFTSLLLSPTWLAGVAERMGGQPLVFAPDTNTVLLFDLPDSDNGSVTALYEMAEQQFQEAARGLSPVGYTLGPDGRVVPYAPPAASPDLPAARRAGVILAATMYDEQTRWLTGEYQKAGMDDYIASLTPLEKPGTLPFTLTTWTDKITSLLPRADMVAFNAGPDGMFLVPWQAVAERVELQPQPLIRPARYRVGDWPPPEVMAQLRALAEE